LTIHDRFVDHRSTFVGSEGFGASWFHGQAFRFDQLGFSKKIDGGRFDIDSQIEHAQQQPSGNRGQVAKQY